MILSMETNTGQDYYYNLTLAELQDQVDLFSEIMDARAKHMKSARKGG